MELCHRCYSHYTADLCISSHKAKWDPVYRLSSIFPDFRAAGTTPNTTRELAFFAVQNTSPKPKPKPKKNLSFILYRVFLINASTYRALGSGVDTLACCTAARHPWLTDRLVGLLLIWWFVGWWVVGWLAGWFAFAFSGQARVYDHNDESKLARDRFFRRAIAHMCRDCVPFPGNHAIRHSSNVTAGYQRPSSSTPRSSFLRL